MTKQRGAPPNAIGYACKLVGVPGTDLRACTLKTASPERLRETARHNLAALVRMAEYNRRAGIRLFRISSDIIPLASHPDIDFDWRRECAADLAAAGAAVRESGLRVSMHPGHYTVLNSPDEGVAERAVLDLQYHADFLDALETGPEAKIVLHVGGVYGDRSSALRRFAKRFSALPRSLAGRLVIENDEKCYAIDEVCVLANDLGVPAVMDVFHHELLPAARGTMMHWLEKAAATWKPQDGRQKIHYSQQLPGGRPGMHSQTIDAARFTEFYRSVSAMPLDIMLEVKDKNLSAVKCSRCVREPVPRAELTEAWALYKYAVLEHSQKAYLAVRTLLKDPAPQALALYTLIDGALAETPPAGSVTNAAQHVWGYFKNTADPGERKRFAAALAKAADTPASVPALKRFLFRLAEKYGENYLLNSLYFYL